MRLILLLALSIFIILSVSDIACAQDLSIVDEGNNGGVCIPGFCDGDTPADAPFYQSQQVLEASLFLLVASIWQYVGGSATNRTLPQPIQWLRGFLKQLTSNHHNSFMLGMMFWLNVNSHAGTWHILCDAFFNSITDFVGILHRKLAWNNQMEVHKRHMACMAGA